MNPTTIGCKRTFSGQQTAALATSPYHGRQHELEESVAMPRVTVRPFSSPADIAVASELLSARHRGDRVRLSMLAAAMESPEGAALRVESQLAAGASGVIAELDGRAVGFLLGQEMLF